MSYRTFKYNPYTKRGARAAAAASGRSVRRGLNLAAARYTPYGAAIAGYGRRNRAPRVKGAIAPYGGRRELKYVDVAQASYACDTTGSVTALNLTAVGDDNTTRDGRQITVKSVQVHGMIFPTDAITGSNLARVMLVWDNAVNSGAIATIAQILTAANSTAFPLVDNSQRFTILADDTFAVGANNNTATQAVAGSPNTYCYEKYLRIDQMTQYSGTTAAIGSIQNGALYLVTIGVEVPGNASSLIASTRVRFTDN